MVEELDFFVYFELAFVACKNLDQNTQKIQFVKLDFYN